MSDPRRSRDPRDPGQQRTSAEPRRDLSEAELQSLAAQDSRLVTPFRADKFMSETRRHWDIFYKRNADRFFKDRHWTQREFMDLASVGEASAGEDGKKKRLLEIGAGAGNFVFPLLEELGDRLFVWACDFSPRAVELVKRNPLYDESRIVAFECDVTEEGAFEGRASDVDIASAVFVLSAVKPADHAKAFANVYKVLKPGGAMLFRDYAANDWAMIRFAAGTKISNRLYLRQDGTTSYFFEDEEVRLLASEAGFAVKTLDYVHRHTVNKKEDVDAPRTFLQGVFVKGAVLPSS